MKKGDIIQGRFEVLREIGRGGMSTVWLAYDSNLNKEWAVKAVKKQSRIGANIEISSVLAEVELLKKLDFIYIPKIINVLETDDEILVIMDYVSGVSLSDYIIKEGKVSQELTIAWGIQLASTLSFLHSQEPLIIYRDMKPSNIMVQSGGNIKLLDFGVSKEVQEDRSQTGNTVALGTRGYAAPEQFGDRAVYSEQSDIYALGMTLFHMVTGVNPAISPEEVRPIRELNNSLSSGLETIILKATANNPKDRYQSADSLLFALENYQELDDEYFDYMNKQVSSWKKQLVGALAFVVLGAGLMGFGVLQNKQSYESLVKVAKGTNSPEDYIKALNKDSSNISLLFSYIDSIKQDGSFSKDDESSLLHFVSNGNFKEDEDYANLMYELGKLYWFYYDLGDEESNSISIKASKSNQYFKKAYDLGAKDKNNAKVLLDITDFYRLIKLNVEEASDAGMYLGIWDSLKSLLVMEDVSELPRLESVALVVNSINSFTPSFKSEGVKKEQMDEVLKSAEDITNSVKPTTEKTIKMHSDIKNSLAQAKLRVKDVYSINRGVVK